MTLQWNTQWTFDVRWLDWCTSLIRTVFYCTGGLYVWYRCLLHRYVWQKFQPVFGCLSNQLLVTGYLGGLRWKVWRNSIRELQWYLRASGEVNNLDYFLIMLLFRGKPISIKVFWISDWLYTKSYFRTTKSVQPTCSCPCNSITISNTDNFIKFFNFMPFIVWWLYTISFLVNMFYLTSEF